ncbi:hypothetical protein [Goodfellowiella coeruleoviolacea]|uniref:hypothetical protein n=1 Tax=Goodfellowiella coeruleoviolacea TaxID=334858 RepID=UPI0020A598E7|nr:hypothetical protein [Goodfellowiella coeruleoviolacea]
MKPCLLVIGIAGVLLAACSAQPTPPAAPAASAKPAGGTAVTAGEIASAFTEFSAELAEGCPGGATGSACQDHIGALLVRVDAIRLLMQGTGNPEFYGDGITLAEQAETAGARGTESPDNQAAILSAVNELHSWMLKHVPGASVPATRVTTTRPPTPAEQLDALAREKGLTGGSRAEASDDVRRTCQALTEPSTRAGDQSEKSPAQWLADDVLTDDRRRQWTELGIPMLCPEHAPVLAAAKSGNYERFYGNGKYVVGVDIPPGVYQITGRVEDCYWERSAKDGDIIDNNFVNLATDIRVTIKPSDGGFTSQRCGVWKKVG